MKILPVLFFLSCSIAYSKSPTKPEPDPGHGQTNICFVKDSFGRAYEAKGRAPREYLRNKAMQECKRLSFDPYTCRHSSCRF